MGTYYEEELVIVAKKQDMLALLENMFNNILTRPKRLLGKYFPDSIPDFSSIENTSAYVLPFIEGFPDATMSKHYKGEPKLSVCDSINANMFKRGAYYVLTIYAIDLLSNFHIFQDFFDDQIKGKIGICNTSSTDGWDEVHIETQMYNNREFVELDPIRFPKAERWLPDEFENGEDDIWDAPDSVREAVSYIECALADIRKEKDPVNIACFKAVYDYAIREIYNYDYLIDAIAIIEPSIHKTLEKFERDGSRPFSELNKYV